MAKHQHGVDATDDAEATMRTQTVPVNVYEAAAAVVIPARSRASTTSRMPLRNARARASLSTSVRSRITPRSGR